LHRRDAGDRIAGVPPVAELWFEFASTYSYPAVERVEALAAARGVAVGWRPFLLGPIFRAQGWNDSPFNLYPAKGRYMWRDVERVCAKHGVAFRRPSVFPRSGLLAARIATAARDERWMPAFVRRVYRANFALDRDIAERGVLAGVLAELGQPSDDLLARAGAPATKDALRAATKRAMALDIFGAPTLVVGDELFWGHDRLEDGLAWAVR
jgi:2-hydroxychromene-2-carboxylate isomerase